MIPEDKWTKVQREFVGSIFPSKKGGVLTVVGVHGKGKGSISSFTITCSICSKDKELFPEGFISTKGHLRDGRIPCGCTKIPNMTKEQYLILLRRVLKEKHPDLKAREVYGKGNAKKVILECDICSKDKELWPYGSIYSTYGNLKKGKSPCSCTKGRVPWKEWQLKLRVERVCKIEGYVFHGFYRGFTGNTTLLDLSNPSTGNRWNTTNICSFLVGSRDPSQSAGGFDSLKPAYIYLNKFYKKGVPIILKFGITNKDTKIRRKSQEKYSGLEGETIYYYHSIDGKIIEELEKVIDKSITLQRVSKEDLPDGFTEAVYYKPFIEKFIVNYIEMLTKRIYI